MRTTFERGLRAGGSKQVRVRPATRIESIKLEKAIVCRWVLFEA